MSTHQSSSHNHNMDQSGNQRKPFPNGSMPIACRVCGRLFFDNVSLIYHFESHLEDENLNPTLRGRTMAALHKSWSLTLYGTNPHQIPMQDSMASLRPTVNTSLNLAQPNFHSSLSHMAVASSSTRPLIHSQAGPRSSFTHASVTVPPLHLREQNGHRGQVAGGTRPQIDQSNNSSQEIIVISDDEEEIDLTLKL